MIFDIFDFNDNGKLDLPEFMGAALFFSSVFDDDEDNKIDEEGKKDEDEE